MLELTPTVFVFPQYWLAILSTSLEYSLLRVFTFRAGFPWAFVSVVTFQEGPSQNYSEFGWHPGITVESSGPAWAGLTICRGLLCSVRTAHCQHGITPLPSWTGSALQVWLNFEPWRTRGCGITDEKVDTGCNSAARLVCCGPANSLCAERKLDSNSRAKKIPPRALVRSGPARRQERS